MVALKFVLIVIVSYFCGNITFARIFAKRRNDDITKHGSGNPGTMNMLRTHGVTMGVITLIFDAVKAAIPCLISSLVLFSDQPYLADVSIYVAGLACIIGHMYPVIFKFKGGKGVASAFGMAMVANPLVTGIGLVLFIITLVLFKIASLSSMLCAFGFVVTQTVLLALKDYYLSISLLWVVFFLIIYAHRSNIKRMLNKKENKINLQEVVQKDIDYANSKKEKRKQRKLEKQQKKNNVVETADVKAEEDNVALEKVNEENKVTE